MASMPAHSSLNFTEPIISHLMYNKNIVKVWGQTFWWSILHFVHHENTQYNHIYCHEKTIWYEMEAFVLNLDFFATKKKIFVLSITFPIIIRNTSFGKWPWWYYGPWKDSSSFVFWNKIRYFTKSTKLLAFKLWCTIFIVLNISFFLAAPHLKIIRATDILESVQSFFAKINLAWKTTTR